MLCRCLHDTVSCLHVKRSSYRIIWKDGVLMKQHQAKMTSLSSTDRAHSLKQRTKAYAIAIIQLYGSLPRNVEAQIIGKQLLRSGTSVGANYREGDRARSSAEMPAKFGVCIQELDETAYWLELLIEAGIVPAATLEPLLDETYQLTAILVASCHTLSKRRS